MSRFLNAVLNLAHMAEMRNGSWDNWAALARHQHHMPHIDELPHSQHSAPDLVFFNPGHYDDKWAHTQVYVEARLCIPCRASKPGQEGLVMRALSFC